MKTHLRTYLENLNATLAAPVADLLAIVHALEASPLAASGNLSLGLFHVRNAVEDLLPHWSPRQHQRMLHHGFATAKDWVEENARNEASDYAGKLEGLGLAYCRTYAMDDLCIGETVCCYLRGRRAAGSIVAYFPSRLLAFIHEYGWTPQTAQFAEAHFDLKECRLPLAPLRPPA